MVRVQMNFTWKTFLKEAFMIAGVAMWVNVYLKTNEVAFLIIGVVMAYIIGVGHAKDFYSAILAELTADLRRVHQKLQEAYGYDLSSALSQANRERNSDDSVS